MGTRRPGGRAPADTGILDALATAGVLAVAVSEPRYGGSDGPPDYCGPATQEAITAVIDHLTRRGHADIGCTTLIMHGAQDDRYDPTHAERFARALRERGRTVELRIFANQLHRIAPRLFWGTANPFIGRCLGLSLPRALR